MTKITSENIVSFLKGERIPEKVSFIELKVGQDLGEGEIVLGFDKEKIRTAQRTPDGIQFKHYRIEAHSTRKYTVENGGEYEIVDKLLKDVGR